ncbi:MAG TPA: flagellar filament capping protein FliD [Solirubrobacterales bacterium]|nr:flagellar filament capping protein FliD [Solirubrobacterales bacterium]
MSPITVNGLGSSLNIEQIIEETMAVESQSKTRLELRTGEVKARETALQAIKTKLEAVESATFNLKSASLWEDVQTVSSSSTAVTAELNGAAGSGGYQVQVSQLARAEQRTYTFTESAEPQTLTIGGQTIELGANAKLADVVAAINSNHETGVSAVEVGKKLVLSSRTTGAESTIEASGTGLTPEESKTKLGLNAKYVVDGTAGESASNVLKEAIPGVTLTIGAVTTGPVTVNVGEPAPSTKAIAEAVKSFVTAYNSAVEYIEAKTSEQPVKEPKTQEEANRGILFGDSALTSLLSQMRMTLSESGLGALGISTGAPNAAVSAESNSVKGLLVFEESKLTTLLNNSPTEAREAITGANGFVTDLEPIVNQAVKPGGGIAERISAATAEAASMREQMTALEERLLLKEERLHSQFTAMETALAKAKSESEWLAGQLAGLE